MSMPRPNIHDKILNAGLEVIHRQGFNASSVQDITDAASVPKGSFYNHFESKEALGVEILDLYWQQVVDPNLHILNDETLAPLERLKRYFTALVEDEARMNYKQGCLYGNLGSELSDHIPPVRERLSCQFDRWSQALATCICDAQHLEQIHTPLDAELLANFLLNAWEGVVMRAKVTQDGSTLEQFIQVIFSTILA